MAKVGLYLKGARGKLAGAVLQKGPKSSTIIREKVNPSNPQSDSQVIQRIKMANAQLYFRQFRSILDHSFEGVKKGNDNRLAFLKYNIGEDGPGVVPLYKGDIIPFATDYIVSKGTLSLSNTNIVNQNGGFDDSLRFATTPWLGRAYAEGLTNKFEEGTPAEAREALREVLGLPAGEIYQVTLLVVTQRTNPADGNDNKNEFVYNTYRVIFGEDKEDDFDYLRTNGTDIQATSDDGQNNMVKLSWTWEDSYPMTLGMIVSSLDTNDNKWRYSTSRMVITNEAYYEKRIAFDAGAHWFVTDVIPSWRKTKKGAESTLYLQAGE